MLRKKLPCRVHLESTEHLLLGLFGYHVVAHVNMNDMTPFFPTGVM